jgi:2,3-bisphosphoglycerate-independent phosphoglycerate mutase
MLLRPHPECDGVDGPVLLVILDGVGLYRGRSEGYDGNAFDQARTPNLDRLLGSAAVSLRLEAHGPAVGMPGTSDMGNSEVGHNAIGAGRVFDQGAKLVQAAIEDGALFSSAAWRDLIDHVDGSRGAVHLIGLLSDGNVHSHIEHLFALLHRLGEEGVGAVRVHALADGRDVDPVTFHLYLERLEHVLAELRENGMDAAIASGGGRMQITMDRYEANWSMVSDGWRTHVLGRGRMFPSALDAVTTLRREHPDIIDQDLPPFVVATDDGRPCGPIEDGDAVLFFNFRGDRAIEISRAFTEADFTEFERERTPSVLYAGMMEYDGDLHIPPRYLVEPPAISKTISELLAANGVRQLATAETQKYGHVTYFWNGNNSEKFSEELEDWIEIPSDNVPFEQTPAMKAREVCAVVEQALAEGRHRFLRVNFANGDMVGHTGVMAAAVAAMEVVDECVGRLERAAARAGATVIVTADHGNLDMMLEIDRATGEVKRDASGRPVKKTSHTLSPVPWLLFGAHAERFRANPAVDTPGLGNIAAAILLLLGYEPPAEYLPPLILPR